ncbi:MFS transporter [Nocardiopsis lambiniae]|uniref:MFS transporter n=1 Tax=Nocardiopsis lambiniae TaxID=3075539 RepID=A0ABU2MHF7_9ACTN|nr:MFS transporter [Nocardiopsis sp. DSM 44743]MDT0331281.1 MFS transporter [Nocardiopsis sp. DSM 44743]
MTGIEETGRTTGMGAPLRYGPFRALATGRLLMSLGNGLANVALAFAVLDVTGSLLHVGLVVGARSIANIVLLLVGGIIADRLPRSLVLRGGCALAALSQGVLGAALLTGAASLPLMVVLSLANGAAAAVNLPAAAALTSQTVPRSLLQQANAVIRLAGNGGTVMGLSLGGAAVAFVGPGWSITFDAVLYALAGAAFLTLRIPAGERGAERANVLRDLVEGWREFTARSWVWIVVAQFTVTNAAWSASVAVLGPAIADETFGRATWGLILAAQSAGMLAGGFLAARWLPRRALVFGVSLVAVQAVPLYALSLPASPLPLLAAMFVSGMAMEQFEVAWNVSVQENVPADRLSRVYSYDALGSFAALPIGQIAIGPVAASVGAGPALKLTAALTVAATLMALAVPGVRRLRRLP